MMFNLERDLVFFDVETTGLHVIRDRIIQLAMIKYLKVGGTEELNLLINPGVPISEEAFQIHGISNETVRNKPTFQQESQKIFDFIKGADLAGYNSNRFDVPILMEEMSRCGLHLDIDSRRLIDVQRIFYRMEPRTLRAAYQFYCNKEIENAHDAMSDIKATVEVLGGMLNKYKNHDLTGEDGIVLEKPIQNDVQKLHDFTNDVKVLDATQRLKYNDQGEVVFAFGKYIGQPAGKILFEDRNYYHWIQEKEFSFQVKEIVKKLLKEYEQKVKELKT
ncbi:MAG: 3'-5' exonuclease [Saprospiraceae bacterium]|nr:3'-5' exonuclease [Saprospiraceae bacterium]